MKLSILTLSLLSIFMATSSMAEELASPDNFKPIKTFSPPKPIAPNEAQGYFPENQFDRTDRSNYYFATETIDQAMRPLKLNSGFYGKNFYNSISAQARGAQFYGMANINHTKANSYKDADGNDAGWGYNRLAQSLVLGFVPSEFQEYRLSYIHDQIKDDKQPQAGSDALDTERHIAKLNARWGKADLSNTLSAEIGLITLDRHADNYSLRNNLASNVFVELDRRVFNFSLKHDYNWDKFHNTFSASYQKDYQNGERFVHTAARDFLNGYRFADVHIDRYRLNNTFSYRFNDAHKLSLGLAYEHNDAEVRKNTVQATNPNNANLAFASAQQIWQAHYGNLFNGNVRQKAYSAELKYDFTPAETRHYSVSTGHVERIGDNNERFNSLAAMVYNRRNGNLMNQNPTAAIVGNPLLKTEKHNFIKLSADLKNDNYHGYMNSLLGAGWNIGGTMMFDKVKDLIIFDRARGQNGVAIANGAIISRNVDARLFTANIFANYNFNSRWAIGVKAFYNYGENESDGRALYQMRPFELAAHADYKNYFSLGSYSIGTAVRYVGKQTRGDFDAATGLGIDRRDSAKSFVVADVYASVNFKDRYGLRLGVNNIFNKKYAEFISGDHVLALSPSKVNAPGRTYWLSFHAAF